MTDYEKLYKGISRAAWGYLLVYFDLTFNGFNILPDFIGWLFFLSAIDCLKTEQPELRLLRPFGWCFVIWSSFLWIWAVFSLPKMQISPILLLPVSLAELYFHFQFLTNLASIAATHQPEDAQHQKRLLLCRTVQTLVLTSNTLLSRIFPESILSGLTVILLLIHLGAAIFTTVTLFQLRKSLPQIQ